MTSGYFHKTFLSFLVAFRGKLPLCLATERNQIGFGVNAAKGNGFYLKVFGGEGRESRKNKILEFIVL